MQKRLKFFVFIITIDTLIIDDYSLYKVQDLYASMINRVILHQCFMPLLESTYSTEDKQRNIHNNKGSWAHPLRVFLGVLVNLPCKMFHSFMLVHFVISYI